MSSNTELQKRRESAVPRGVANAFPIYADRADNAELWDIEGRRFIDFAGGIAVLNTGHRHPTVTAMASAQEERFTHTSFQVLPYESYITLAEKLNALAPGDAPKKTIFLTTGAEAVENAVKIARVATGRPGVIAFSGAFHGRTMLTMALTGKVAPYKQDMGPFPGEVYRGIYPCEYHGVSVEQALVQLKSLMKSDAQPNRIAAMIIEPVQGEGGYYITPPAFLKALREICDENGILLIADEIQSGFARTGKYFAIEHSGVVPDLITTAKSLAGGYTLSGVIGRADVMDAVPPGGLGGTYGGNPVACAAALGVLQAIEEEGLLQRSSELGEKILGRFKEMAKKNSLNCIGDARGLGAMVSMELVKDRETHEPDPELTKALTAKAMDNGLVLLSCGLYGNVIRIMVPITASDAIVDEGLDIIERSLEEVVENAA
jgi:4-aminobutyrate aminotransferase/(S)-3-amino-2-methylpropionate transaminase